MRVLVCGATGVLGRPLVAVLVAGGHQVVALARSQKRTATLEEVGVEVVTADALDPAGVRQAVAAAAPDALVHLLTAIPEAINPRRMAADFAATNRLRTEGTRNLLDAAKEAGVRRVVTESVAFAYDPSDRALANEDTPLWPAPPKEFTPVLAALRELESRTLAAGGVVLRYGHLYGPGSHFAADGSLTAQLKARKLPLVGGGGAIFSFIHAADAASATAAAVESDVTGKLNIVDDEPAPMSEWAPFMAELVGARKPMKVPAAVARLLAGGWGVAFLTQLRGASNARAKQQLGWQPGYSSWRGGFASELAPAAKPA
jgi:nucleoside-diphosphate-sugar epimerase